LLNYSVLFLLVADDELYPVHYFYGASNVNCSASATNASSTSFFSDAPSNFSDVLLREADDSCNNYLEVENDSFKSVEEEIIINDTV
jgi:hypothetical protein